MGNIVGRQFYISKFQQEVIAGSLLGDGRLESRSKQESARLRIHHGWKQKDIVFWKYRILENLVSIPPKKIVCWKNPRDGSDYYSWYFHTRTISEFKMLYKAFYPKGKKILPENISTLLTPVSLAVWVMDDGCNTGDSLILNTHNFSIEEHLKLNNVFLKNYRIATTINKDRDKFRLRFSKQDALKLIEIISPYIIQSMKYKIVPVETSRKREMIGTLS